MPRWIRGLSPVFAVAILVPRISGCGGAAQAGDADPTPEQVIFVYDRSSSMQNYKLALARDLTNRRLSELDHGDRIVAMELLEASLDEPPERWSQKLPEREHPGRRVVSDSVVRSRFLRDVRAYLRTFTDTTDREEVNGTDILSTLHDVAADHRAHPDHRTTLYLFSDMLQADRELNFERPGAQPPSEWVEKTAEKNRLPDLEGLCIVVVGARVDTERGQKIKAFWRRYFDATGAVLRDGDYLLRPVRLPEASCG